MAFLFPFVNDVLLLLFGLGQLVFSWSQAGRSATKSDNSTGSVLIISKSATILLPSPIKKLAKIIATIHKRY
ncbi:hypothetical protein AAX09_02290 [Moraxella bovoculi]|nr:hypothetical protein AAX09_02290 [Moraxella bovoculi]